MIENDKHIQDWSDENKQLLLDFVIANCGVDDYIDICAVGSRVYWNEYADSDIDVVVFRPDEEKKLPNTYHQYDGINLTIGYFPISQRDNPLEGYKLSQYSLKDAILYLGSTNDELAFKSKFN